MITIEHPPDSSEEEIRDREKAAIKEDLRRKMVRRPSTSLKFQIGPKKDG